MITVFINIIIRIMNRTVINRVMICLSQKPLSLHCNSDHSSESLMAPLRASPPNCPFREKTKEVTPE